MNTSIRRATKQDIETIAKLAIQMWESHSLEEMAQDFSEEIHQGSKSNHLFYEKNIKAVIPEDHGEVS